MLEKKRFIALRAGLFYLGSIISPGIITLAYASPNFKTWLKTILNQIQLLDVVKVLEIPIDVIGFVVIPYLVTLFSGYINNSIDKKNSKILSALITHIDTIVGSKNKRFFDYCNRLPNGCRDSVFNDITQPLLQMNEVIKNIVSYFEYITNDHTIKCSLLRVKNSVNFEYFICLDGEPTTDIVVINNDKSTASICVRDHKIIVVENTCAKNAKFKHSFGSNSTHKSIICFPVSKGPNIAYVISITSKNENTFRKKDEKIYEFVLEQFGKRLILETYLSSIKEAVNG